MRLYRTAFDAFRAGLPLTLPVIALKMLVEAGFGVDNLVTDIAAFCAFAFIAIAAHRRILLGETLWAKDGWSHARADQPPIYAGRFIWLAILFGFAPFFLTFAAAFWSAVRPAPLGLSSHWDAIGLTIVAGGIGLLIQGVLLAIWGSTLPAAAAGARLSLKEARLRGRPYRLRTLCQLLIGPVLFTLLVVLFTSLVLSVPHELILDPGILFPAMRFIGNLGHAMSIALAATVLSAAYRDAANAS